MKLLLLLGGHYHDFDGFEAFASDLLSEAHIDVRSTSDPAGLTDLEGFDVVLIYTCHVRPPDRPEDGLIYTEGVSDGETLALSAWVRAGGGLVAAHSATTIRPENLELQRLLGGRFVSHPPRFSFTIVPMLHDHPVMKDVGAFTVTDELYTEEYADVEVHAVAVDRGTAHPMVWTRWEDEGRVVHVAPGHDESTWSNPSYRRLLRQSVEWAGGRIR